SADLTATTAADARARPSRRVIMWNPPGRKSVRDPRGSAQRVHFYKSNRVLTPEADPAEMPRQGGHTHVNFEEELPARWRARSRRAGPVEEVRRRGTEDGSQAAAGTAA